LIERADLTAFALFGRGGSAKGWRVRPEEVDRFEREGGVIRLSERSERQKNRAADRGVQTTKEVT